MLTLFWSFLINVVIGEIQGARTKLNGAKASTAETPTATEDRAQTYGVGTFRVAGNVVWSGDEMAKAIKEKVKVSLFQSKSVTVGYEYHIGLWMTLAGMTCDQILAIDYGDDTIWSGVHELGTGVSELVVNKRWKLTDEDKVQEGMSGTFRFFNVPKGHQAPANSYVERMAGESVPAYPGTLHVVWVGPSEGFSQTKSSILQSAKTNISNGLIGASPQLKSIQVTAKVLPKLDDALPNSMRLSWPVNGVLSNEQTRQALNEWLRGVQDIYGDANPALAALELLTTRGSEMGPHWGAWTLDTVSFLRAAERLKREELGVSLKFEVTRPAMDILIDICTIARGLPMPDHSTGRIAFVLIRASDAPVVRFDDSNVIELTSFERYSPEEVPNLIEIPFRDRENSFADRVAHAKNSAGIKTAGAVIVEQVQVAGVSTARMAKIIATRELRERSAPWAKVSFTAFLPAGSPPLQPGCVITLEHSPLGQTLRLRITSVRYGSLSDSQTVRIEALEDVARDGFESGGAVSELPPPPAVEEPEEPEGDGAQGGMMLAPYALSQQNEDVPLFYLLPRAGGAAKRYRLAGQPTFTWDVDGEAEYTEAQAQTTLPVKLAYDMTPHNLGGTSYTIADEYMTAALETELPSRCLAVIGDEWMYLDRLWRDGSTVHANVAARGIYDTSPAPHAVGDDVILLTDYLLYPEVLKTDLNSSGVPELAIRAEIDGELKESTQVAYRYTTYQSPGRAPRPLPPARVRVASSMPAHTPETASVYIERNAATPVAWFFRDRNLRKITGYTEEVQQYCGLQGCARIGWLRDDGTWVDGPQAKANVDADHVLLNCSTVPAGERLGRVKVWAEDGAGVRSREHVLYVKFRAAG